MIIKESPGRSLNWERSFTQDPKLSCLLCLLHTTAPKGWGKQMDFGLWESTYQVKGMMTFLLIGSHPFRGTQFRYKTKQDIFHVLCLNSFCPETNSKQEPSPLKKTTTLKKYRTGKVKKINRLFF